MFDELKEVNQQISRFSRYFKVIKRLKKSLQKSRVIFRIQANICDRAFLWIHLTAHHFCNKISITDVRLGYV